jgi:hypothetical protein
MEFWIQLNTVLAPVANVVLILVGPALWHVGKAVYLIDKRLSHVETVQKLRRIERAAGVQSS